MKIWGAKKIRFLLKICEQKHKKSFENLGPIKTEGFFSKTFEIFKKLGWWPSSFQFYFGLGRKKYVFLLQISCFDSGRYRQIPSIKDANRYKRAQAERAAINAPIQGGAADIVMVAMIKIHQHERLRELGWKLILQVSDVRFSLRALESENAATNVQKAAKTVNKARRQAAKFSFFVQSFIIHRNC